MTSTERKRQREHAAFEMFLRCKGIKPSHWSSAEPPEPDIFALIEDRNIGVEITGIDDEFLSHRIGSARSICADVERQCSERTVPPMEVRIHGLEAQRLNKAERSFVATRLADLLSIYGSLPDGASARLDPNSLPADLESHVHSLSIWRSRLHDRTIVSSSDARFVPPLDRDELQRALERKSGKRRTYCRQYDEAWLLVSANDFAAWVEVAPNDFDHVFQSDFDRVFFLANSRVWDVPTKTS